MRPTWPTELHCRDQGNIATLGDSAPHAGVTSVGEKDRSTVQVAGSAQFGIQYCVLEWPTDHGKRFATLRAHRALKGYSLHHAAAGDGPVCFYVTRRGMALEPAAVRAFAEQVGATHA